MIVEQCELWESNNQAYYVKYLLDNTPEIDINRKLPAVIVCPGGAYLFTSDREGEPIALQFLAAGYQAFVLRYTVKGEGNTEYPVPLYDLAKMILTVRQNAEAWNIDPSRIAICGFSAGGHLCASLAVHWQESFLQEKLGTEPEMLLPNAVILGYPCLDYAFNYQMMERSETANTELLPALQDLGGTKLELLKRAAIALVGEELSEEKIYEASPVHYVSGNVPPVFLWHTAADDLVFVGNSLKFALKLEEHKIPFEMHIFETGPHGLSMATNVTSQNESQINEDAAQWVNLALRFLARRFD